MSSHLHPVFPTCGGHAPPLNPFPPLLPLNIQVSQDLQNFPIPGALPTQDTSRLFRTWPNRTTPIPLHGLFQIRQNSSRSAGTLPHQPCLNIHPGLNSTPVFPVAPLPVGHASTNIQVSPGLPCFPLHSSPSAMPQPTSRSPQDSRISRCTLPRQPSHLGKCTKMALQHPTTHTSEVPCL